MHFRTDIFIYTICTCLGVCGNAYSALKIEKASFPPSAKDISFSNRMELLTADYKNYEGLSPYEIITIEQLNQQRQNDKTSMSHSQYCDTYPLVPECNPTPEIEAAIMALGDDPNVTDGANNTQTAYPQGIGPATSGDDIRPKGTAQNNQQGNHLQSVISGILANRINNNNNSTVGGNCTPSQRYAYFDKGDWHKLTSHRYDTSHPAFAKAMFNLLRVERPECHKFSGQYGGMTCYGFASVSNPDIDVTKLTLNQAEDRTFQMFYKNTGIYKLPDHIMGDVMHVSFWRGASKGIKALYTVLGMSCGKRCSTVTDDVVTAAKNYNGDLHNKYWTQVWEEVKSYPKNRPYLKGFGERVKMARQNGCHSTGTNPINF